MNVEMTHGEVKKTLDKKMEEKQTAVEKYPHSCDLLMWSLTQILDYAWAGAVMCAVSMLFGGDQTVVYDTLSLARACALLGFAAVGILHARERVYFWLFADRIAHCKHKVLSKKTLWYILQTSSLSMSSFFLMYKYDIIYFKTPNVSMSFWMDVFGPFYILLVLRDVFFLFPLHTLMHASPFWYSWHKMHHEVTRDAQSLHAFHIELVDLLVENVGAPFLLLGGQYVLGLPVGLHWFTGALLTVHDGALHSVNPFSVMYFNPIFDWLLEPNVNHQLHHALNKGHYTFVPWEHALSPAKRTADCNRYNQVFKTNFVFARSSLF